MCVFLWVCLSAIISSELHVLSSPNLLSMLPMAVNRPSSGGVVTRYVLPVLWMTSYYLLISQGCSTSPPSWRRSAHAALGLAINCAVIPVEGQRKHGTTFRAPGGNTGSRVCGPWLPCFGALQRRLVTRTSATSLNSAFKDVNSQTQFATSAFVWLSTSLKTEPTDAHKTIIRRWLTANWFDLLYHHSCMQTYSVLSTPPLGGGCLPPVTVDCSPPGRVFFTPPLQYSLVTIMSLYHSVCFTVSALFFLLFMLHSCVLNWWWW